MAGKLTGDAMAIACADAMWANDKASKHLGMKLEKITVGVANVSMQVSDIMLNGHDICHGGYIFTLADSAFAFACNSYNQLTVAQQCTINFINPAHKNDILIARATERMRQGRSGIYDVTVTNQNNEIIAEFRGASRTIKGNHLPDNE